MTFNIPEQKRDLYLKPSEQGMSGNLRYTWVLLSHVHLREAGLSGWLCPSVYHVSHMKSVPPVTVVPTYYFL